MELVAVPPSTIDSMWAKLMPHIEKVLAIFPEEGYSPSDINKLVKSYDAQMWTTTEDDAIFVTQIQLNNLQKPYLLVWLFQADELLEEHWELLDQIKAWGKFHGCTSAKVIVRPGFEKLMIKHGWKKRHVTVTQEI